MLPTGQFNSARLKFVAAGLCALLLQLAIVQSVDASCGDWLAGHSPTEMTGTASFSQQEQSDRTQHTDQQTPSQRGSCHGPFCQNAPVPLAPPVPVPTNQSPQQWLKLTVGTCQVDVDVRSRMLPQSEPLPESASRRRLERPPCC